MKLQYLIEKSNQILRSEGIQSYILDTQLLLAHFLKVDKLFVIINRDFEVADDSGFYELVYRRAKKEPMQYILGVCEFMSLDFIVTPDTLIPRPDTEILTQKVIDFVGDKKLKMLEIGTGSGCISVSCLKYCENLTINAVDISQGAINVAKRNAKVHNVDNRINFTIMDILKDYPEDEYNIIVSNPPYIEESVIPSLMVDVRDYEPISALVGGVDGLDFYRRIIEKSKDIFLPNGLIAFEVGHTQSESVIKLLKNDGYKNIAAIDDLSGIPRVVFGGY